MPYRTVDDPDLDDLLIHFGEAVRQARLEAGLSQEWLERRTGVDQTAISRLERGRAARIPLARVLVLAEALGGLLPIGQCPHDHRCRWRDGGVRRRELEATERDRWVASVLEETQR